MIATHSFRTGWRSALYERDKYTLARLFPRLSDVELAYALAHEEGLVLRAWAWRGTISWLREQEEWAHSPMWELVQVLPEKLNFTFACDCAERALHREREQGREPHPDSWHAPQVRRLWLKGEASDEELKAADIEARSAADSADTRAAYNAAWSAASNAAGSAAYTAAWNAADSAAWNAADSAAESAAWSAADSAARAEERLWQMGRLAQLMEEWKP